MRITRNALNLDNLQQYYLFQYQTSRRDTSKNALDAPAVPKCPTYPYLKSALIRKNVFAKTMAHAPGKTTTSPNINGRNGVVGPNVQHHAVEVSNLGLEIAKEDKVLYFEPRSLTLKTHVLIFCIKANVLVHRLCQEVVILIDVKANGVAGRNGLLVQFHAELV